MNYEDAMMYECSRDEARREFRLHGDDDGANWAEFVSVHGDREVYSGATVLGWLGY